MTSFYETSINSSLIFSPFFNMCPLIINSARKKKDFKIKWCFLITMLKIFCHLILSFQFISLSFKTPQFYKYCNHVKNEFCKKSKNNHRQYLGSYTSLILKWKLKNCFYSGNHQMNRLSGSWYQVEVPW